MTHHQLTIRISAIACMAFLLASAIRKGQSKDTVAADEAIDADHVSSLLEQWAVSSRMSLQKLKQ